MHNARDVGQLVVFKLRWVDPVTQHHGGTAYCLTSTLSVVRALP
jgi:hypothetical protein